jgi:hypothetical protein
VYGWKVVQRPVPLQQCLPADSPQVYEVWLLCLAVLYSLVRPKRYRTALNFTE